MEFVITRDKRNELLSRRELEFTLRFDGATPSRTQIIGKLCALINANEKHAVLDRLRTSFGKMELKGSARVYDTPEARDRTERGFLMTRGMPKPKEEAA
jgi:small subunit ribosomal protein S24e